MHTDQQFTPEWAKETLKAVGYKPRVRLVEYIAEEEMDAVLIALKVLKLAAHKSYRNRKVRFILCRKGGKAFVKTVFEPRVKLA
jgi:hypothetical protein